MFAEGSAILGPVNFTIAISLGRPQKQREPLPVARPARARPPLATAGAAQATRTNRPPLSDGEYRLDALPPGDYIVAVVAAQPSAPGFPGGSMTRRAVRHPDDSLIYPTMFHPSAGTIIDAHVITLGSGEERFGVDLQWTPVGSTAVTGPVVWPGAAGGTPIVRLLPGYVGELTNDRDFTIAAADRRRRPVRFPRRAGRRLHSPRHRFDQSFLERLLSASIAVTLADGERKVQNIRLQRPGFGRSGTEIAGFDAVRPGAGQGTRSGGRADGATLLCSGGTSEGRLPDTYQARVRIRICRS